MFWKRMSEQRQPSLLKELKSFGFAQKYPQSIAKIQSRSLNSYSVSGRDWKRTRTVRQRLSEPKKQNFQKWLRNYLILHTIKPWSSFRMRTNYFLIPAADRTTRLHGGCWHGALTTTRKEERKSGQIAKKKDGVVLNLKKKSHWKKLCWIVAVEEVQRMMHLKVIMKKLKKLKIQVQVQALLLLLYKNTKNTSPTHDTIMSVPLAALLDRHLLSDRAAMMIVFESIRALGHAGQR